MFGSVTLMNIFCHRLSTFFDNHGIICQFSFAQMPQQNEVAKHKLRHLLEDICALLFQIQVPESLWSDGVLTAGYLVVCHGPRGSLLNLFIHYLLRFLGAHIMFMPLIPIVINLEMVRRRSGGGGGGGWKLGRWCLEHSCQKRA